MRQLRSDGFISVQAKSDGLRQQALATACIAAICLFSHAAKAQDLAQAGSSEETVRVTGTRIERDGYNAPTPVTVVGTEQIQAANPANLQDFVNQLPSVIGSSQTNSGAASISGGGAGISALNLRALGQTRTLVLLNGHRSSPSLDTGVVDINTFPQQLVSRIDVVTGGASADYGSDAVGGVVNFILDTRFTGFKSAVEYGETTYGDQPNYKGQATFGMPFDSGRGHVIVSGEVFTSERIVGNPRAWNNANYHAGINPNAATTANPNGQPWLIVGLNQGPSQVAPGGLIYSGPARGTYFGLNGTVNQLTFGQVYGQFMQGGDTAVTCANYCSGSDLTAGELRQNIYGRVSYDLLPDMEVYAEGSYAKAVIKQNYLAGWVDARVTLRSDNAFLPASVRTVLASTTPATTSFILGTSSQGLGESASNPSRNVTRFEFGAKGDVHLFADWKYDFFGQYSATDVNIQTIGNWQTQRMTRAQNAVVVTSGNVGSSGLPIGSIQCLDLLSSNAATRAAAAGCQPLSRIGINGGLQDAAAYQRGKAYVMYTQPFKDDYLRQTNTGINITGSPFENWAGPVSVAFGGEWRLLSMNADVPLEFRSNWQVGNYQPTFGHYSVAEGYVSAVVPIMPGMDAAGAIRYTAYSTSGGVNTWKMGLNYAPIDDVRFRFTYSHDIRAPNLGELFAGGLARSNTVIVPGFVGGVATNQSVNFVQNQVGNPDVTPEAANSLGAGVVLSPSFISDLVMSIDYYNITVKHQIGVISAQDVVNLCYQLNVASYCPNIKSTGSINDLTTYSISTIDLKPINFSSTKTEGIDFDITYTVPLEKLNWFGEIPGLARIHALATHYMSLVTNDGLNPITDVAGTNQSGGVPSWVYRLEATYATDPWTFNLIGRGVSAGVINNNFIVCSTSCPVSTVANRTINNNSIDGAFYLDLNVSYAFEALGFDHSVFFTIKNVFNTNPTPVPVGGLNANVGSLSMPQTNPQIYDIYGRIFRFGIRSRM
jgi:outer membrane receptor protein involved in Fe transport